TIVRHIKEKGLEPIAKLHAFRDDKCAKANNDMGVKYYDTKYIWLDNAPESGGRAWLNPYNEKSRQYIAALCGELSKKGFSKIIVDSLQFPSGLGREKSGYGNMYEGKSAVLKDCIKEISDAVKANGGMATFIFDVNGIESDSEMLYGGDVIEFYENNVMLSTSLEKIDSAVTIASRFKGKSGKTPEIMLQAYNNDGGQPTQDDMQKAIEKLGKIDVTGYCLFNPQGIYQF
ncbi:MAG: putative glycoside hydrolase, partial [Oscillospiraceae bacterium]